MPAAFCAAWLLVLQSMLGAFASGIEAAPLQLDAFGNVICTQKGAAELPAGDQQHRQQMPACCLLGCAMASAAHGAAPDAGSLPAAISFETIAFAFRTSEHFLLGRDWSPSNPRAPPLAA